MTPSRNDVIIKITESIDTTFPELGGVILGQHELAEKEAFGKVGYNFYTGTGMRRLWWFCNIKGLWVTFSVYSQWNGSRTCINDWWSSVCVHYNGDFVKVLNSLREQSAIGQKLGLGMHGGSVAR